eukprot:3774623-Pyramimonas_sp.AAC.1
MRGGDLTVKSRRPGIFKVCCTVHEGRKTRGGEMAYTLRRPPPFASAVPTPGSDGRGSGSAGAGTPPPRA